MILINYKMNEINFQDLLFITQNNNLYNKVYKSKENLDNFDHIFK